MVYQSRAGREAGLMRAKADVGRQLFICKFGGSGRLSLGRAPLERHGLQYFGKCAFAIAQACHGQPRATSAVVALPCSISGDQGPAGLLRGAKQRAVRPENGGHMQGSAVNRYGISRQPRPPPQ
jgi:hypothetical protein